MASEAGWPACPPTKPILCARELVGGVEDLSRWLERVDGPRAGDRCEGIGNA